MLLFVASARMLPRTQPLCTKVSLPSGRTSLTVACRSTFGVDDLTHRRTAPAPMTVVVAGSGSVTYATALPAEVWLHW